MALPPNVQSQSQSQSTQQSMQQSQSTSQSQSQSSNWTAIVPGMMAVYNQILGLNEQNYANIIATYNSGMAGLAAGTQAVNENYNQLSQAVMGGYQALSGQQGQSYDQLRSYLGDIYNQQQNQQAAGFNALGQQLMGTLGVGGGGWGVATPGAQAIAQNYAQASGQTQQDLINRGLGNTSVGGNLQSQQQLAASQAYGGLSAQLSQLAAGYQSQVGLAKQAALQQLGLTAAQAQQAVGLTQQQALSQIGQAGLGTQAGLGQAQQSANMQGLGLQENLTSQQLGTLGRFKFEPDVASHLTGSFGQSSSESSSQSTSFGESSGQSNGLSQSAFPRPTTQVVGGGHSGRGTPAGPTQYPALPSDPLFYGQASFPTNSPWMGGGGGGDMGDINGLNYGGADFGPNLDYSGGYGEF